VTDFFEKLKNRLTEPLPGSDVQFRMAPLHRPLPSEFMLMPGFNPKMGSVLILLYPFRHEVHTVYILRSEYRGVHSGQVCFPGGKSDPADGDLSMTALRETDEEIGVGSSEITILGELTRLYIPPSNFLVTPYVGFVSEKPHFRLNEREVAGILTVDIPAVIASSENVQVKKVQSSADLIVTAPYFDVKGYHIWGATAMITNEFIEVVKSIS
jgi:8-oxo-dGTP pyrophosphatase MutT (NUDIX family)